MKLFLVRHAETGDQNKERYFGSTDLSISEKGHGQAAELLKKLERYSPSRCLCSPMLRARQTFEYIERGRGLQASYESDLREIDFGEWEGLTFAEICRRDPMLVKEWNHRGLDFEFPGGESGVNFCGRISRAAQMIASLPDDEVLVVAHGGVLRAMICYFLGVGFENYLLFAVKPASIAILEISDGGGVLAGLNI